MYKSLLCAALACVLTACGDVGSGSSSSGTDNATVAAATATDNASLTTQAVANVAASGAAGQSITITVPVSYSAGQLLDFEVHAPNGARLAAPGCCQTQLPKSSGSSATITYAIPANTAAGVYTIAVGVFASDWSHLYSWNNAATTFTVGATSSPVNNGSTSSSSGVTTSSSSSVAPGGSITLNIPVSYSAGQLLDFEVHAPNGSRLAEPGCCLTQLPKSSGSSATITYTVPSGAVSGVYSVAVGVFASDWSHLYYWNNSASTFTVGGSSSATSSSGSNSSSSSSSSSSGGATTSSSSGTTSSSGVTNSSSGIAAKFNARLGKPNRLLLGLGTQGDADDMSAIMSQNLRVDIHERYLVGVGGGDWTHWLPSGEYVTAVANDASSIGAIPLFVLYSLSPDVVGGTLTSSNLQNSSFMTQYWNNARLMYQMIAKTGKPALVNLEPDFFGFAEQQGVYGNYDGAKTSAQVSVNPDCSSQPNNVIGLAGCLVQMARRYASNAYVAFPPTDWGANGNIGQVVAFNNEIGAGNADFIILQTLDGDAGCYEEQAYQCQRAGSGWYWDESNQSHPNFNDYFATVNQYQQGIGGGRLPVLLWQNPEGVPSSSSGYKDHFRDNREHYFLTHTSQVVASHIFAITFNAGSNMTNVTTDGGQYQNLTNSYLGSPTPLQ
jgi:hypothetical protein